MVKEIREEYNKNFSQEKYDAFINELNSIYQPLQFRMAETPVFVSKDFLQQMLSACESIIDVILQPNFKHLTQKAIPPHLEVQYEDNRPDCITFDFGVCTNASGLLEPQLIEMQAFPSLFAYEVLLDDIFLKYFPAPLNYSSYLSGLNRFSYLEQLKKLILKNHLPEDVILLEIFPEKQKTSIDFYTTEKYLGIKTVCITQLIKKGRHLFYTNNNKEIQVKRIYNRIIFDELLQQEEWVKEKAAILFEDIDVEWCPHPNWFYRISKFTLPLIHHPNIPETYFLDQIQPLPKDLENYVLKPLFSFAGQGVVIDVEKKDIDKINDPENWILQRKVTYAPVIHTLDEPAKVEIRLFYFWPEGASRPIAVNNLARLSKGKMIGVRYNKDKTWTGGSFALFERDA